jgi:hypothetical protein
VQIRRVHGVVPSECGPGQMPRNPHGDSPWNPGPDEIPDSAPAKKQALVVPNFGPGLDSQSYLNACSLKRLPQVSCIKHPSLPRQFLENSIRPKRQGQQNRVLILVWLPSIRSWNLPFSNSICDHVSASAAPILQPVKYRNVTSGCR